MKGCQGTCVKDTWTKPKGSGTEGGRLGFVGRMGIDAVTHNQLSSLDINMDVGKFLHL